MPTMTFTIQREPRGWPPEDEVKSKLKDWLEGLGGQVSESLGEGTFELVTLEATGIYRAFQGGHNHIVDRLHQLADGSFDEFCFCNISQYDFP